jgi:hypothetical protein
MHINDTQTICQLQEWQKVDFFKFYNSTSYKESLDFLKSNERDMAMRLIYRFFA